MNLHKIKRIYDISKEDQTDQLKYKVYTMVLPFVQKYQPRFYPQYRGDLKDLASQFYLDFMGGSGGDKESLLDSYDPSVSSLPYYVKIAVQRALIDESRTDKGEVSYDAYWNDKFRNSRQLVVDFISGRLNKDELTQLEDMEFDADFISEMKDRFQELSPEQKYKFERYYNQVKGVLSPNFQDLFSYVESDFESNKYGDYHASVTGRAPDFTIEITSPEGDVSQVGVWARSLKVLEKKLQRQYPGIVVSSNIKVEDSCRQFFSDGFLRRLDAMEDGVYRNAGGRTLAEDVAYVLRGQGSYPDVGDYVWDAHDFYSGRKRKLSFSKLELDRAVEAVYTSLDDVSGLGYMSWQGSNSLGSAGAPRDYFEVQIG